MNAQGTIAHPQGAPETAPRIALTAQRRPAPEGWVLLDIPKALLVLSREEFITALRRGKAWKRREALAARIPAGGDRPYAQPRGRGGIDGEPRI